MKFTVKNSTFCLETVFMCFVWISEQTAIISLYNNKWLNFDVFLTVHLSIFISVFNQLDAQNLFHNKFYFVPLHVSNTCAHHQEGKIVLHSLWYHHTYRWPSRAGRSATFQTDPGVHAANARQVSFPDVKRPGLSVDHPPPHLVPRLKKEYRYTCIPSLGLHGLF